MLLPLHVIPPIEIMDNMQCIAGASGNCRALIRSRCPGGEILLTVSCGCGGEVSCFRGHGSEVSAFPAVPDLVAMPLIPMLIPMQIPMLIPMLIPIPSGPSGAASTSLLPAQAYISLQLCGI